MKRLKGNASLIWTAAAAVLLLVVSLAAVAGYYSSQSALLTKDQEILRLQATALSENATILKLELEVLELDSNVTALDQRIYGLTQSQAASLSEIASLRSSLLKLENESSFVSLELQAVEGASRLSVVTYFANFTMILRANSTVPLATSQGGSNGTIVYLASPGCPGPGLRSETVMTQLTVDVVLDSRAGAFSSGYRQVAGEPFNVAFENVGPDTLTCTFSLFYVYHG